MRAATISRNATAPLTQTITLATALAKVSIPSGLQCAEVMVMLYDFGSSLRGSVPGLSTERSEPEPEPEPMATAIERASAMLDVASAFGASLVIWVWCGPGLPQI